MIIVGLCGGSGCGKTTVANMLSSYGIATIDTDKVYHGIVSYRSDCVEELVREFGEGIVSKDGSLNRRALSTIVFGNGSKRHLDRLNEITHKHVIYETEKILSRFEAEGVPATIIDAPLLFESGLNNRCNFNVCVVSPIDIRIDRIMKRDGITRENAEKRIASQMPDSELIKLCERSIDTSCTLDELNGRVAELAKYILDNNF